VEPDTSLAERAKLPADSPWNPRGFQFKCNISRHISDYRLYAVWQVMLGFAGGNKKHHTCFSSQDRIADALGCSIGFVNWAQKEMVRRGLLIVQRPAGRDVQTKRWLCAVYSFAQHDEYKKTNPCPAYRFDSEGRVIDTKNSEQANRFRGTLAVVSG